MTTTWTSDEPPPEGRIGPAGWLRVIVRGGALGVLLAFGLLLMVILRLIEAPLHGVRRPWTPWITLVVCRAAFRIMGIHYASLGEPLRGPGAVVANHASWLDIFSLNARKRIYFVSKAEVASWPGIGLLAKATGTLFINRDAREARTQRDIFEERLKAGHKLLFFPEGTSTDGQRVLPFKSTLFAAFFAQELRDFLEVQPVTVIYRAPIGEDPRFYGWWGDMSFGSHVLRLLAAGRQGKVEVIYHPAFAVRDFADRKELARACETAVREGLTLRLFETAVRN